MSLPSLVLRATIQLVLAFGVWGGLLFASAGHAAWWRAWLHLGTWLLTFAFNTVVLLRVNPAVISVRLKPAGRTEQGDAIVLMLLLPATLGIPIVAGLDAVRWQWCKLPFWTVYAGLALHLAGGALLLWTMTVNPFLEKTLRVQSERGHRVITTGPYAVVRHPMYSGVILMLLAIPPVLGSAWALVPVAAVTALLIYRTGLEESLLRRDLPGYEAYTTTTPWRILPGIW